VLLPADCLSTRLFPVGPSPAIDQEAFKPMSDKRHILSVILGIALLTTPVYAASQRRPQTPATRPPAPSFRSAPAPVFHPPHPPIAAAPARYHQPPSIAPRVAYNQPPIHTYAPPHPGLRPVLPVLAPPVARNQHIAPVKFPPFRLPSTYPANHAIPPAYGIPARVRWRRLRDGPSRIILDLTLGKPRRISSGPVAECTTNRRNRR